MLRRTLPDWGMAASSLVSPDIDTAEIAARLGALNTFRRSGRVLYQDECDNLARWIVSGAVAVDTNKAFTGNSSIKFTPATLASITNNLPMVVSGKYGIEITFWFTAALDQIRIRKDINFENGRIRRAQVTLDMAATGKILVLSGGVEVQLASVGAWSGTWNNLKLVTDYPNSVYSKLYINHRIYDLSSYVMDDFGPSALDTIALEFRASQAVSVQNLWIDNIIFTTDEP